MGQPAAPIDPNTRHRPRRPWELSPVGVDHDAWLAAWHELARDCPPPAGLYERASDYMPDVLAWAAMQIAVYNTRNVVAQRVAR